VIEMDIKIPMRATDPLLNLEATILLHLLKAKALERSNQSKVKENYIFNLNR
jgi:hypothetical protein